MTAPSYSPVEMLAKLVGFPTVSRDSNLDLIHFVRDYLSGHGVESHLVFNADKDKANLYATVGPMVEGGIVLSGHTDVVPVDGQSWTMDPFKLTEKDGKLYGRGSCDMKAFDAIALAAVPKMLESNLARPFHLALSYDEELACAGAPDMIREMKEKLPPSRAVVVGEPTGMNVVTGHKGFFGVNTHVRGYEVHSSQIHVGVSAVMVAARLVNWLEDTMRENEKTTPANDFVPPFTTLHCGVINGGTAPNIVAKDCSFTTDIRVIASERAEDYLDRYRAFAAGVEKEMQAVRPDTGITIEVYAEVPGLRAETEGRSEALCRELTGDTGTHVAAYGTEAGQFQDEGFSACVCGPGSVEQAHQADEFMEADQFEQGVRFMDRLIGTQIG